MRMCMCTQGLGGLCLATKPGVAVEGVEDGEDRPDAEEDAEPHFQSRLGRVVDIVPFPFDNIDGYGSLQIYCTRHRIGESCSCSGSCARAVKRARLRSVQSDAVEHQGVEDDHRDSAQLQQQRAIKYSAHALNGQLALPNELAARDGENERNGATPRAAHRVGAICHMQRSHPG